ncbi:MAG: 3-dehydroquinate synthase [Saprospiraceae bacterium]|nr:3-dehydroquinate synthase [Saprospiraceae bacterium]
MKMKPVVISRIFQARAWEKLNEYLEHQDYSSIFIVVDENTNKLCLPLLLSNLSLSPKGITVIPAGELHKDIETCMLVWNDWLGMAVDRKSLIITLGGGVLCDLVGFCAATFKRGLDCVYIPSTLMAMADAAFGGKTGVNLHMTKNIIGLFHSPQVIVLEPLFLNSLDERHMRNGFVEIIKHALIQDPPYWQDIENLEWPLSEEDLQNFIRKSMRTKMDIVEQDPSEIHIRKALNFGHTIGHAIEKSTLDSDQAILHGEAVAMGMIAESIISARKFKWKPGFLERITSMLIPFVKNISWDEERIESILKNIHFDKKNIQSQVLFSLLEQPGKPALDVKLDLDEITSSLEYFHNKSYTLMQ